MPYRNKTAKVFVMVQNVEVLFVFETSKQRNNFETRLIRNQCFPLLYFL